MVEVSCGNTAGVDEAGRGPLAGPVVAAAVILGEQAIEGLTDSKKLSPKRREFLFAEISSYACAIGVGQASPAEIDALNIHHATLLAMTRAVADLTVTPSLCLVDGKFCPDIDIPCRAMVGGDGTELVIGAASIIAKVTRDRMMMTLHQQHPEYGFDRHKGYPTAAHLQAVEMFGVLPIHRRSFAPIARVAAQRIAQ